MRAIPRVKIGICPVKNQAVFGFDLNLVSCNHHTSHTADSQFSAGCQSKRTTDPHLHGTTDRYRVVTTDVSGISTANVNSISPAHVIRTGRRDIHSVAGTVYPAEGAADNNAIGHADNAGG